MRKNNNNIYNFKESSDIDGGLAALGCLGIIFLVGLIFFLAPLIVWFVWNTVLVPAFGLPPLSFWAVFGILLVLDIIGGFFKTSVQTKNN